MIARARRLGVETPLLALARTHVAAYEARRIHETAGRNAN